MANINSTDSISSADGKTSLYKNIKAEVDKKQALYDDALKNENSIIALRNAAKSKYITQLNEFNRTGNKTSIFTDYKNKYDIYSAQYSDANINTDVLRCSLNNSTEYLGKINNMPDYFG